VLAAAPCHGRVARDQSPSGSSDKTSAARLVSWRSVEPHGFRAYLETTSKYDSPRYRPDDYWEYLRANLEPAILASNDGHRWAQAVEAVERTEAKSTDPLHVALIKNIAVIDLFRNGSGLAAETVVLEELVHPDFRSKVADALEQLSKWRVVLFKKHIGAWSVFEGSDFDIDSGDKPSSRHHAWGGLRSSREPDRTFTR